MSELWMQISGFDGLYSVSSLGRVRSDRRAPHTHIGKILKPTIKRGYACVCLRKNGKRYYQTIHKLVVIAFIGAITGGRQVNHKNGIKNDNRIENLEIVTPSENTLHAYDIGLATRSIGESHHCSKLNPEKVNDIRQRYSHGGESYGKLARNFGVSVQTVFKIVKRKIWRRLPVPT